MRAHLHLLSVLQLTWGGIMLMLGVSTGLLAFGAAAVGWTSTTGAEISAAVTSLAFGVFAVALLAGGAANSWAGRALRRFKSRGRMVTLGLAVANLFVLPFGTALGIYAFWVLLHNETRTFFEAT